jgi:hypothetical protein
MGVSRRSFLAGAGTLTALAAATPLAAVATAAPNMQLKAASSATAPAHSVWTNVQQYKVVSQYQFTPELFRRLIGQTFQVKGPKGSLLLRLNGVEVYPQAKLGRATQAFAIRFGYVQGSAVEQGTYEVHNPALGDFLLFIVPAALVQRPSYTAVINHI